MIYLDNINKTIKWLEQHDLVGLDIETTGLHYLYDEIKVVTIGDEKDQFILTHGWSCLKSHLEKKTIVIQNSQFDCCFLAHHAHIFINIIYDTRLVEQVLLGDSFKSASLKNTVKRYNLGEIKDVDIQELMKDWHAMTLGQMKYIAEDIEYMMKVRLEQMKHPKYLQQETIISLENECAIVTYKMRLNGIKVDEKAWRKRSKKDLDKYNQIKSELLAMVEVDILWTSTKQVKEYFLNYHQIEISSYTELFKLKGKNEVLDKFILLREHYQSAHTFGEGWLTTQITKRAPIIKVPTIAKDGRVHPNYTQILNTGRYSCSQPNLQQLPRDEEVRKCFVAEPKNWFVVADYSSEEAGIAATLSREKRWIDILKRGESIHDQLAIDIYGNKYTKEQRQNAKTANFTMLYGAGVKRLAETLDIPYPEAKKLVNGFKRSLPRLWKWMQKNANDTETYKISRSHLGRIRDLRDMKWTYTIGLNNPIQATGADIMKLALVLLQREIDINDWSVKICLTIHDEVITEVYGSKLSAGLWAIEMKRIMEDAANRILKNDYLIKAEAKPTKFWTH